MLLLIILVLNPPLQAASHVENPIHAEALSVDDAKAGSHRGFPAMFFEPDHVHHLTRPYFWTLIGKFSQGYNKKDPKTGRPSVEDLQKDFGALDLKAAFPIGFLDNRHLMIKLHSEEDYLRVYSRAVWYIGNVTMRI